MTTMTALTTQVYSVFIRATPEQVWDAITKPEFTEQYFYGARIDTRDGRRFTTIGEMEWDEEVLEAEAPTKLVHRFVAAYDPDMGAEDPSRVTWEIEPQDGGFALLTVTHDGLESSPKTAESVSGAGWMMVLSGVKTLLETGEPLAG
jgi:uncharacterized protein YndB with AHSA1/START domain